jgi:hypothetical protein
MPTAKMIVAQSFQLPQPPPYQIATAKSGRHTYKQAKKVAAVDDDLSITVTTPLRKSCLCIVIGPTPCLPTTTMMT